MGFTTALVNFEPPVLLLGDFPKHSNAAFIASTALRMKQDMPHKRLIVCIDGTQNDSINASEPLTNVARLARCASPTAFDGVQGEYMNQIVYYQSGVGTGTSTVVNSWDMIRGRGKSSSFRSVLSSQPFVQRSGVSKNTFKVLDHNETQDRARTNSAPFYYRLCGANDLLQRVRVSPTMLNGIECDIREAYTFICHNYLYEKDEIVLIGFSRGSFTVRALARLINDVGILQKAGLRYLGEIFDYWANQPASSEYPSNDSSSPAEYYVSIAGRHLIRNVKIKACAVWDTVAALPKDKLAFVDERMPPCLERAIQAVALNEERSILTPMLWKADPSDSEAEMNEKLRQCWFLARHTDIYGEDNDGSLANISLAWMLAQLHDIVAFDKDTLGDIAQNNTQIARREVMSRADFPNLHEVYELRIRLLVEEFDIQFKKLEKSERVAGWSIRKPFSSGPLTNEQVHWSVPDLLEKKLVQKCKPLSNLNYKYRVAEVDAFERALIQTWASKDCIGVILDIMRTEKINGKADDSASAVFVPIYAVLLRPEDFAISVKEATESTIQIRPKQEPDSNDEKCANGKPITRSIERSFKMSRLFKAKEEWILSGSIEVPNMSNLNHSGLDMAN